jgi:succinate-acetate transporter protein
MACFVGGLVQLLAGMWEFAVGNTFGATGECLISVSTFVPEPLSCALLECAMFLFGD